MIRTLIAAWVGCVMVTALGYLPSVLAQGQQPPSDLDVRIGALQQEQAAQLVQMSQRAATLAAELASVQAKLKAAEAKCKPEEAKK